MSFIPTLQTNYAQLVTCICRNKTNETDFTPQMRFIIHSVILFLTIECSIHFAYSFIWLMSVMAFQRNILIANCDLYCSESHGSRFTGSLEYNAKRYSIFY